MQIQSIRQYNPSATILSISATSHQGVDDLLRLLWQEIKKSKEQTKDREAQALTQTTEINLGENRSELQNGKASLPVISLSTQELRNTWSVTLDNNGVYHVTGEKIEKFARRTDLSNYASANRLRDIMKKLGIRAELTNQGAGPDSLIEISGKTFTLVEQY